MKKLGLLVLAAMVISLSSCGGDDAKKAEDAAKGAAEKVEQKAQEVEKEVKEEAAKVEEKASEAKEEAATAAADVDGKTLFMENGCVACHNADKKTVGPAIKEIAAGYASKDDLVKFLKGEGKAIIDPAQFAVMQPNLATTKKMNDAQRAAIADYMLSFK
jgi:cytochrome c